jgi:hypothetical protein
VKRALVAVSVLVAVGLGLAAGFALYRQHQSRDIRGSETVEFVAEEPTGTEPQEKGVVWPTYGYDPSRTRSPGFELRPPFRKRWQFGARNLVEFPPAIAYGRLYF